jgi:uncharacterized protein DUF5996
MTMMKRTLESPRFPALPFEAFTPTRQTLHMYAQVVGKLTLLKPFEPQWANVPLLLTARGMTTGPIPYEGRVFEVDLDFISHQLRIATSDGGASGFALRSRTVADFYALVLEHLRVLHLDVEINPVPQEVPDPIPCTENTIHDTYEPFWAHAFWRVLSSVGVALNAHRASFRGKTPPVAFMWGTFDLRDARLNGRPATPPEGAGIIYRRAMDAEQIEVGFWPGDHRYDRPALFAFTYPKPDGIEGAIVGPRGARWEPDQGEFLMDYDDVRGAGDPHGAIVEFARTTYAAGANAAGWDPALVAAEGPD